MSAPPPPSSPAGSPSSPRSPGSASSRSAAPDLDLLLDAACVAVSEGLGVDASCLLEPAGDDGLMLVRAGRGWHAGFVGSQFEMLSFADARRELYSRGPVVIEDLPNDTTWRARPLRDHGVVSAATVLVGPSDDPAGLLGAYSHTLRVFSSRDLDFLSAVAHVLNGAMRSREVERQMRHDALHDALTGLPNRTLLLERLTDAVRLADADNRQLAVFFLDVDHLKVLNDSLGHHAGDELLRAVGPRLRSVLRSNDMIARFGGDEFAVLCSDIADEAQALRMAERLVRVFAKPFEVCGEPRFCSTSVGVVISDPQGSRGPEELLSDADAALYRAKERGRGRHEVFNAGMRDRLTTRLRTEDDLRRALEAGDQLWVAYQPFYRLPGRELAGVEALLRWKHPERGPLSPAEFIPVAEDSGLIVELGEYVLRTACAQVAAWGGDLHLTVNVSARQMALSGMPGTVGAVLRETGLPADRLALEITEGLLLEETHSTLETLQALRNLGVYLMLDDFGTGYSSLGYLRRYPLDALKIDRVLRERPRRGRARRRRDRAGDHRHGARAGHEGHPRGGRDGRPARTADRAGLRLRAGLLPLPPAGRRGARGRAPVLNGTEPREFPLSDVLGALSYALDITEGEPPGHSVRALAIGMRIAEQLGLGDDIRSALFYALLLKDAGCSSNASRLSSLFAADDHATKRAMKRTDWSKSGSLAMYTWRAIEPGGSPLAKARRMRAITQEEEVTREMYDTRCERGAEIALMLALPEPTADAIRSLDEHWDGSGHPRGLRGEEIPLLGRILCLAQTVEVFVRTMGSRGAYAMTLKRRGKWFDPSLVDAMLAFRDDAAFWGPLEDPRAVPPAARWEPTRPDAARRRGAARPRGRGLRARDRREVAVHRAPLDGGGGVRGGDRRCDGDGRDGAARPAAGRAAARHRQAGRVVADPRQAGPPDGGGVRRRQGASRVHAQDPRAGRVLPPAGEDGGRPPRAARRRRLPPRAVRLRPVAPGTDPRRRRRLRGDDGRPPLPHRDAGRAGAGDRAQDERDGAVPGRRARAGGDAGGGAGVRGDARV